MLWRDGWDTKAQRLAVFESLVACRPNAALHVLVASSVHGVEPLGHVLDAVELGRFSQSQQIAEALGALDALFEEGGIAVERHHSHAPFNLVVVRADAGIMQEAAQFLPVVEPEDHSLADRASFPSQIPAPIPLDSVLFRERHHDLIDAVHQRSTVLSAEAQDAFELLLTAFSFLPVFRFFPAVELAQG